jgi:uncharacterized protein (DUF2336 family)
MHAIPQLPDAPPKKAAAPSSEKLLALSGADVKRLLTEETPDARIDVLKKVAQAHAERKYSLRELTVAEQILRVLVRDTELSVREALTNALKDNPQVPHDIVIALARDVDSVALPIIESSDVLTDTDLIALVQSAKHANRPTAVARRKTVSKEVSAVLAETHNPQVVTQLVKNTRAVITEETLQAILREHGKNQEVTSTIAQRPDLPVTVVEKVITLVSDTLAESLRMHYSVSAGTIAAETEKTREIATLKLVDGQTNTRDVEKLVEQLQVFGRLTPSIILTSLCRGNLHFFETSLARLSNIPVRNAQLLIHDKGGLGFKALYGKAGLPDKFFNACKLLLEVVAELQRPGGQGAAGGTYANTLAQKLLARASGKDIENLSYIIALIRQHA